MTHAIRSRLSLMMLIQYGIWGAWYVPMSTYLGDTLHFSGKQIGLSYTSTAIGAMASPFFVGMIADRFFATEKILAVLHFLAAAFLYLAASMTQFRFFYPALIGVTLCYMPTLALTNSLSFHQMKNIGADFPLIKTLGSIGWIIPGLFVGGWQLEATRIPFLISCVASVAMAIYCLTLPHTPPKGADVRITAREILGLDALRLMREKSFAVFVIGSFLTCIPLTFYFSFMNRFLVNVHVQHAAAKMTLGQVSDVIFLLLMPIIYARLGVKRMLLLGMTAWAVRFFLFSQFANHNALAVLMYAGILLHGICYDFFFVMGQIYVDQRAPAQIRGTAQGFIAFVTLGMGMFVGSYLSGIVVDYYTTGVGDAAIHNWPKIWLVPAIAATAILMLFALLFRDRAAEEIPAEDLAAPAQVEPIP